MMTSEDHFCFRFNLFEQNFVETLNTCQFDNIFTDATLVCADGQIETHKVVISSASSFFMETFYKNPHSHPLLYLKGVKIEDLKRIISFIYNGEVNVEKENLSRFLDVANILKIKGLTQKQDKSNEEENREDFLINSEVGGKVEDSKTKENRLSRFLDVANILKIKGSAPKPPTTDEEETSKDVLSVLKTKEFMRNQEDSREDLIIKNEAGDYVEEKKIDPLYVLQKTPYMFSRRKENRPLICSPDIFRPNSKNNENGEIKNDIQREFNNKIVDELGDELGRTKNISNRELYKKVKAISQEYIISCDLKNDSGRLGGSCKICKRDFTQQQHALDHIGSHIQKKIYSCEHCGKSFHNFRNDHMQKGRCRTTGRI